MNTEEFVKEKINEMVDKFKTVSEAKGITLSEIDIMYFKSGIVHGMLIAGLSMVNIDGSKLI